MRGFVLIFVLALVSTSQAKDYNAELTAYCSCQKCCSWHLGKDGKPKFNLRPNVTKIVGQTASGKIARKNHTLAAPKQIPFNSKIYIDVNGEIVCLGTVEDRGGAINIKDGIIRIDVYFDNHREALIFGRKKVKIHSIEMLVDKKIKILDDLNIKTIVVKPDIKPEQVKVDKKPFTHSLLRLKERFLVKPFKAVSDTLYNYSRDDKDYAIDDILAKYNFDFDTEFDFYKFRKVFDSIFSMLLQLYGGDREMAIYAISLLDWNRYSGLFSRDHNSDQNSDTVTTEHQQFTDTKKEATLSKVKIPKNMKKIDQDEIYDLIKKNVVNIGN